MPDRELKKEERRIGKVAVLCGGEGAEREVSLRSGRAVSEALKKAPREIVEEVAEIDLRSMGDVRALAERRFDFAFIALHGGWGEDGVLQAELEKLHLPYTGTGPQASRAAMHKNTSRLIFAEAGLTIPRGMLISAKTRPEEIRESLGEKIVVKPCSGGSTVGVSIVTRPQDLPQAVELARSYDSEVLAEEYIDGKELTVAVLERDGSPQALPPVEIEPQAGFYDYENKYTVGATRYLAPAPLPADILGRLADAALTAHRVLQCKAYSRSDFRLSPSGEAYILEINTAPGMTETSLVPKAAEAVGLSFADLVLEIIFASR